MLSIALASASGFPAPCAPGFADAGFRPVRDECIIEPRTFRRTLFGGTGMASAGEIISQLRAAAKPGALEGMKRFAIAGEGRLGVSVPDMRKIAKKAGRDHALALDLWKTGIPEARIVAGLVGDPAELTSEQMDDWAADFESWDVCDQVCMNLFDRSPLAWKKVREWARRDEEFVRRASFALIASLAVHDKAAPDSKFAALFPIIRRASTDDRNFVKKAVNWALRQIGKRNRDLNRAAVAEAAAVSRIDSRAARWIAADALRELDSEQVRRRLKR